MVQPGMILAGKYQVERVLGQGGMGCVVSAVHLQLGQRVAIKFLLPEALRIHEAVERFLREARAAVRLRSEHVGRVIDVGQFDDGAPYMVMEYLDGQDLAATLARSGTMPVAHAVDFILQACEAIAEAHSLGIVHRDLKPANLFLTRRADGGPLIKVLDFGISKAQTGDPSFNMTRTTSVMGSPGYMSPEQLRSTKDCDARTDIWALGVILYELTSGRQPFVAESITELALRVAMDPTPPMQAGATPAGFEAVVHRCLAKDAKDRFQNIAELAAALVPYGPAGAMEAAMRVARVLQINPSSLSAGAPTVAVGGGGKPTTLSHAAGTYGPVTGVGKPRRTGVAIGAVLGLAVAGGVVAVVLNQGGGDEQESAPAAGREPDRTDEAETQPDPPAAKVEPAKVVEEPAKVVEEPAKVVEEPAKVVEEPAKVVEEPAKVVEEPAKVAEEPAKVVEEPVAAKEEPRRKKKPRKTVRKKKDGDGDGDISDSRF